MAPRGSGGPGPRWQSLEPEPPPPEGPEDTSLEARRGGPGSQSLNWASAGRRSGEEERGGRWQRRAGLGGGGALPPLRAKFRRSRSAEVGEDRRWGARLGWPSARLGAAEGLGLPCWKGGLWGRPGTGGRRASPAYRPSDRVRGTPAPGCSRGCLRRRRSDESFAVGGLSACLMRGDTAQLRRTLAVTADYPRPGRKGGWGRGRRTGWAATLGAGPARGRPGAPGWREPGGASPAPLCPPPPPSGGFQVDPASSPREENRIGTSSRLG